MRKIKDKIIKMLGGIPKKEYTKEVEIAHKQGAACAWLVQHLLSLHKAQQADLSATRLSIEQTI